MGRPGDRWEQAMEPGMSTWPDDTFEPYEGILTLKWDGGRVVDYKREGNMSQCPVS